MAIVQKSKVTDDNKNDLITLYNKLITTCKKRTVGQAQSLAALATQLENNPLEFNGQKINAEDIDKFFKPIAMLKQGTNNPEYSSVKLQKIRASIVNDIEKNVTEITSGSFQCANSSCQGTCVKFCGSGCTSYCTGGCSDTCNSDCSGHCSTTCGGCDSWCSAGCSTTCSAGCEGGCNSTGEGVCSCTGACFASCHSACLEGCGGRCNGTATGGCNNCGSTCVSTCKGNCGNTCTANCRGNCAAFCSGNCSGVAGFIT